jgi:hypothetical protein
METRTNLDNRREYVEDEEHHKTPEVTELAPVQVCNASAEQQAAARHTGRQFWHERDSSHSPTIGETIRRDDLVNIGQ